MDNHLTFHTRFASFMFAPAIEAIVYFVALTGTYSSKVMKQASILYHVSCGGHISVYCLGYISTAYPSFEQRCLYGTRDNGLNLVELC